MDKKEVHSPHARAEIVHYMHEQHEHFSSRRIVNLMYPNFFWANMGRDVGLTWEGKSYSVAVACVTGSIPPSMPLPSN
jgi:hypothetical protein